MIWTGDILDGKYKVTGICSDSGGMETILFVDPINITSPYQLVLKYCRHDTDIEAIRRFCRETRYLNDFKGNPKILQIYDSNLEYTPPYFVMRYYPDGDLGKIVDRIVNDVTYQEKIFYKMIDCISELHDKGYQHRDIKPQNFLIDGDDVIVSDLGLAKAVGAGTTFTVSRDYLGTYGYMPPEFDDGDFKEASPPSDIFMLGKSFYWLLTKRNPLYLNRQGLHPAIFHVIEKCCNLDKEKRYPDLAELKQDLNLAFDIIFNRESGIDKAKKIIIQIQKRLDEEDDYSNDEIMDFLNVLDVLSEAERNSIIEDLPQQFYGILAKLVPDETLFHFFRNYEIFVREAVDQWSYAETVANYMKIIFDNSRYNLIKVKVLEIAIQGAIWARRFNAENTCKAMIYSIKDESLGLSVSALISSFADSFLRDLEVSQCQTNPIRIAIRKIQLKQK